MSDAQKKGHKRKGYYVKSAKGKRQRLSHVLEAGQRGFLLTCNNREKQAVAEAYNLLNEYSDQLYGPEETNSHGENATSSADAQHKSSDSEEDIEAALKKEVSSLKEKQKSKRRFQVADSGANNCIFIKTTVDAPDHVVHSIFTDIHKTKSSKSRFIMRIQPVIGTCRADDVKLRSLVSEILPKYFAQGETRTYCILIKVRNNNKFGKNLIFPIVREVIQEMNPNHSFDGENPEFVVSVDVIKSVCCISVMKDYYKFRKYNLQEVVKTEEKSVGGKTVVDEVIETPESNLEVSGNTSQDEVVETPESNLEVSGNTSQEKDPSDLKSSELGLPENEGQASTSQDSPPVGSIESLQIVYESLKRLTEPSDQLTDDDEKKDGTSAKTHFRSKWEAAADQIKAEHTKVLVEGLKPFKLVYDELTDKERDCMPVSLLEELARFRSESDNIKGTATGEMVEDLVTRVVHIMESMLECSKPAQPDTLKSFSKSIDNLVHVVQAQGQDLKFVQSSMKSVNESMDDIHDSTGLALGEPEDPETLQELRAARKIQSDTEHTRTHANIVDTVNNILESHTIVFETINKNPGQITEGAMKVITEKIEKIISCISDKSQIIKVTVDRLQEIKNLMEKVRNHPEGVEAGLKLTKEDLNQACKVTKETLAAVVDKGMTLIMTTEEENQV